MDKTRLRAKTQDFRVRAHYFCGIMGEAVYSMVHSHRLKAEALRMQSEGDNTNSPAELLGDSGLFARYAFLSASNAFENCAYTILAHSGKLSSSLIDELDRLSTLNKFEVFALMHGKSIDRGDDRYSRAKQVIRCRNEFVHPKGLMVEIQSSPEKAACRPAGGRDYPMAFDFLEVEHAVAMIGDILKFVAWVVFDICKFSPDQGAKLINGDVKWWIMAFHDAHELWNYDLRSLGNFEDIKVTTIELASQRIGKHSKDRKKKK